MYTSADVRASVSSIHERARTTQQTAQVAPGAHSGYRGARSSARATPRPRADLHSELHSEARVQLTALLRRLDYLLASQPTPSPALTRSLLDSMRREALALAGLLARLDALDASASPPICREHPERPTRPQRPSVSVPDLRVIPQEGAPC